MRCAPGQLAMVVFGENIGAVVRVLRASSLERLVQITSGYDGRVWDCEALSRLKMWRGGFIQEKDAEPGAHVQFHDAHLRPLRDPGEDARDETLEWKEVPETTPAMLDRETA